MLDRFVTSRRRVEEYTIMRYIDILAPSSRAKRSDPGFSIYYFAFMQIMMTR